METLTTTVKDPKHPDEPWVVTTTREKGETWLHFMQRHQSNITKIHHFLKDV